MEMDTEMEELPYVVWYQCRMCTHVFLDDVEKMFVHLDKKHGAMIDCEDLKNTVYKNGLAMGGLSRSPTFASSSDVKDELDCSLSNEGGHDDDDEADLRLQDRVLLPKGAVYAEDHNDDFEQTYEESYHTEENLEQQYAYDEDDDEDQLVTGNSEEFVDPNEVDHQAGGPPVLVQYDQEEDDYDENEADFQNNEDEAGQNSLTEEDELEEGEQRYEFVEDEEEEEDDEEEDYGVDDEVGEQGNGIYSNDSKQAKAVLNYGYSCKFCGKFFTTRRGVESHEQHHKNQTVPHVRRSEARVFPCKLCKSKTFSSFKELKMHVKAHTPERIHICKFCFSTFNNTASLTKHLTIHRRENPNKCFCGKTFVSANTLKIHKKIHTGVKPFVCNFYQCGRAFVTKSTLESHLRTHTGEKPYQCTLCPSSFTTSSAKYRHERHVHKIPDNGSM